MDREWDKSNWTGRRPPDKRTLGPKRGGRGFKGWSHGPATVGRRLSREELEAIRRERDLPAPVSKPKDEIDRLLDWMLERNKRLSAGGNPSGS